MEGVIGMTYSEDELNLLAYVPQVIGTAIASASNSGLFGTGKELFASASALTEGVQSYPGNSLIRQIAPDPSDRRKALEQARKSRDWAAARMKAKGVNSAENLRALMIEDTKAVSSLLATRASPKEASEYKQWALAVAEKVANASSEGGFLGFGGERVTEAERALIGDVKSALGISAGSPDDGAIVRGNLKSGRKAGAAAMADTVATKPGAARPLAGRKVMITAGPTHEAIGAVHYIAKRSSGRLGYALAEAAVGLGAQTVLVSGPVDRPLPPGAQVMMADTALDMLKICQRELPSDIVIFAAAVADWRLAEGEGMMEQSGSIPELRLIRNPDIAKNIATRTDRRPAIVVGFTIETEDVIENGRRKLADGSCDLIVVNDRSPSRGIIGSDSTTVHLVSSDGVETWSRLSKHEVANRLMQTLVAKLGAMTSSRKGDS
jgi:hypothetical protein